MPGPLAGPREVLVLVAGLLADHAQGAVVASRSALDAAEQAVLGQELERIVVRMVVIVRVVVAQCVGRDMRAPPARPNA